MKTVTSLPMELPLHYPCRRLPCHSPPPSPVHSPPLSTSYHHDVPHHHRIGFTGELSKAPSLPVLAASCLFYAGDIFGAGEVKFSFLKFLFNCYLLWLIKSLKIVWCGYILLIQLYYLLYKTCLLYLKIIFFKCLFLYLCFI